MKKFLITISVIAIAILFINCSGAKTPTYQQPLYKTIQKSITIENITDERTNVDHVSDFSDIGKVNQKIKDSIDNLNDISEKLFFLNKKKYDSTVIALKDYFLLNEKEILNKYPEIDYYKTKYNSLDSLLKKFLTYLANDIYTRNIHKIDNNLIEYNRLKDSLLSRMPISNNYSPWKVDSLNCYIEDFINRNEILIDKYIKWSVNRVNYLIDNNFYNQITFIKNIFDSTYSITFIPMGLQIYGTVKFSIEKTKNVEYLTYSDGFESYRGGSDPITGGVKFRSVKVPHKNFGLVTYYEFLSEKIILPNIFNDFEQEFSNAIREKVPEFLLNYFSPIKQIPHELDFNLKINTLEKPQLQWLYIKNDTVMIRILNTESIIKKTLKF